MATNFCNCPTPPGGTVTCEDGQLAICVVRNGVIEARCVNPPTYASEIEMSNWILSTVTGDYRHPQSPIEPEMQRILVAGRYESDDVQVTFRLIQGEQLGYA